MGLCALFVVFAVICLAFLIRWLVTGKKFVPSPVELTAIAAIVSALMS